MQQAETRKKVVPTRTLVLVRSVARENENHAGPLLTGSYLSAVVGKDAISMSVSYAGACVALVPLVRDPSRTI